VRVTYSLASISTPTAVALGNFDGLHLGHRQVIQPVLRQDVSALRMAGRSARRSLEVAQEEQAKAEVALLPTASRSQPYATVVTFHPHPREFFTGQSRPALTPIDEKVALMQAIGVEQLVLLPFNCELASLNPQDFVENILIQQLQARRISVGQNFCFGRQRSGTVADLQAIAANFGVEVVIVPTQNHDSERISSSAIRQALQAGEITFANRLLGRPYRLIGQVVEGQQLGRKLGFPTANLHLPPEKFLPRLGVYGVRVGMSDPMDDDFPESQEKSINSGDGGSALTKQTQGLPGVMNVGCRPTVAGTQLTVEVHLLDWSGDLYGKILTVDLETFLRPEQKFSSLDELKAQIQVDCIAARETLAIDHQGMRTK
jgi:riboflavin kinase / FMN adenylyltransferase